MVCWWLLVYFGLIFASFASFIIAILKRLTRTLYLDLYQWMIRYQIEPNQTKSIHTFVIGVFRFASIFFTFIITYLLS